MIDTTIGLQTALNDSKKENNDKKFDTLDKLEIETL